ncbi:MAG: MBOAT family protein [Magnetococcales bacterium]|nr:MBOAT family protein [Magnetococcales bacterium]
MSFVDPVFLFVFLPLALAGYQLIMPQQRDSPLFGMRFLAMVSTAFYACWDIRFLPILLFSTLINFGAAKAIFLAHNSRKKTLLVLILTANLSLLALFKYTAFALQTVAAMLDMAVVAPTMILPLGISFFTFTQIAYVVDVYRGSLPEERFVCYFLFVTWFPHLIAGPILHHREMMPQFYTALKAPLQRDHLATGLTWVAVGLFKKAVLADGMAHLATPLFQGASAGALPGWVAAWSGLSAYALQLYFDFSGYCDMAIGLSYLFGVRMPLNFNAPYKAVSIMDFWSRWHMTLSRFLRDYLYIPLGGNRLGEVRKAVNIMLVMLLGGLWHGAGWTFIVWGGLHGCYILINHLWRARRVPDSRLMRSVGPVLTVLAVVFAWTFFRASDLPTAIRISRGLFGLNGMVTAVDAVQPFAVPDGRSLVYMLLLWVVVCWFPNSQQILARTEAFLGQRSEPARGLFQWQPNAMYAIVGGVALAMGLFNVLFSPVGEFLYFQF